MNSATNTSSDLQKSGLSDRIDRFSGPNVHLHVAINQERLLLLREVGALNSRTGPVDNLATGMMLTGQVDVDTLQKTLNHIVRRHAGLRSAVFKNMAVPDSERRARLQTFASTGLFEPGLYLQTICESVEVALQQVDLSGGTGTQQQEQLHSLVFRVRAYDFDGVPPGLRVWIVRLEKFRHVLLIAADHLFADGWSMRLLRREVGVLYAKLTSGVEPPPGMPISFADFTIWQSRQMKSTYFDGDRNYWREQWAEFGSARVGHLHIPFALPPSKDPGFSFASSRTYFPSGDVPQLREFIKRSRLSPYMFFLAAYVILLRHYTGKQRLAIWGHFSNRGRSEVEDTIGCLTNTHLLGFNCEDDLPCIEFFDRVRSVVSNAFMHQEMPIAHLWTALGCHPRFNDARLLLDVYSVRDEVSADTEVSGDLRMEHISLPDGSLPRYSSLGVYVEDDGKDIALHSKYATALFSESGVAHMIEDLKKVTLAVIADPGQTISQLATLANRFSRRCDPLPRWMGEFILNGSDSIPQVRR